VRAPSIPMVPRGVVARDGGIGLAQERGIPVGDILIGRSSSLSIDEAIADALEQLPERAPNEPVLLEVQRIRYQEGGVIGGPFLVVELG
jgi:hypothetical protein